MAISLKRLYLAGRDGTNNNNNNDNNYDNSNYIDRLLEEGISDEGGGYVGGGSGKRLYNVPRVDPVISSAINHKNALLSLQIFHDFYAMELMNALFGSGNMSIKGKVGIVKGLADKTGINPALIGIDWDNVIFPLSNVVLPEKLRSRVEVMYEEVVIGLAGKMMEHLRRTVIQEFSHFSATCEGFNRFKLRILNKADTLEKKISKEDYDKIIKSSMSGMVGYEGIIIKLLKYDYYYNKGMSSSYDDDINMDSDKNGSFRVLKILGNSGILSSNWGSDNLKKKNNKKGAEGDYYDIDKDPDAIDISKKDKDKDKEDGDDGDGKKWDGDIEEPDVDMVLDPTDPFSKKVKKNWKDRLNEETLNISKIRRTNRAMHKAGLTIDDMLLAYNNIKWTEGFGGNAWGQATAAYLKLRVAFKKEDINKMASMIDHVYDLSHNNGPLLDKGGLYISSIDLDRRSKINHLGKFINKVSPDVKTLLYQVLRYIPKSDYEINFEKYAKASRVDFSFNEKSILTQYGFYPSGMNDIYSISVTFLNKQNRLVDRDFSVYKTTDGKYILRDSLQAEDKICDSFDELTLYFKNNLSLKQITKEDAYYNTIAQILKNSKSGNKDINSDKAQLILDTCNMGWFGIVKGYVAVIDKINDYNVTLFVLNNGYLVTNNSDYTYIQYVDWDSAYEKLKELTVNSIPLDNERKNTALRHINALKQLEDIANKVNLPPKPGPVASVTPSVIKKVSEDEIPFAKSTNAYNFHFGITTNDYLSPIRLTIKDENILNTYGFTFTNLPNYRYHHDKSGVSVWFYPNNTARINDDKLLNDISISEMLTYISTNYNIDGYIGKQSGDIHKNKGINPGKNNKSKGINPGNLFLKYFNDAGLFWDANSGEYTDGYNTLHIDVDRSSELYSGGNIIAEFNNLKDLITYLQNTKLPSNPNVGGTGTDDKKLDDTNANSNVNVEMNPLSTEEANELNILYGFDINEILQIKPVLFYGKEMYFYKKQGDYIVSIDKKIHKFYNFTGLKTKIKEWKRNLLLTELLQNIGNANNISYDQIFSQNIMNLYTVREVHRFYKKHHLGDNLVNAKFIAMNFIKFVNFVDENLEFPTFDSPEFKI